MDEKKPAELFDVQNLSSLFRQEFRETPSVSLSDFNIPVFEVPSDYVSITFSLPPENYGKLIRDATEPVSAIAESKGYSGNFFTALYEAVKNAHEHGNRKDPTKSIAVAHKINDLEAKVAIIDQGGVLDPDFIPFVIAHRELDLKQKFLNYYEFSGKKKPHTNLGTGTSFMHVYADAVEYFKSHDGGLVVQLTKKKASQ